MTPGGLPGVRPGIAWHDLIWMVVLVLIGVFQVLRGAWVDTALFGVTLLLVLAGLALDARPAARVSVPPRRRARPRMLVLAPLALAAGLGLWVAPRHGVLSGIIVGLLGVAAVLLAWPARPGMHPSGWRPRRRALAAWAGVVLLAGLWEASAYLLERWGVVAEGRMPAISEVLDPMLDEPLGKAVFVVVWLVLGVALARRGWGGIR